MVIPFQCSSVRLLAVFLSTACSTGLVSTHCSGLEGDQYGRRNPSVAVDQSGHRGNPNGLGFGSQISWQNIDGRTVAMSFCTIVKDTVLFRMPQGGFARVPLKHLSESSRAVALQLHKSSIYEHLTEIGPNATPLVWGGTGGGKAKLRLLAVDGGAAAFEDSHHQIIITSLDKVAPESMGHLVSLCKSVLAKVTRQNLRCATSRNRSPSGHPIGIGERVDRSISNWVKQSPGIKMMSWMPGLVSLWRGFPAMVSAFSGPFR